MAGKPDRQLRGRGGLEQACCHAAVWLPAACGSDLLYCRHQTILL